MVLKSTTTTALITASPTQRKRTASQPTMQRLPTGETVITPRNFKLLEELERSEKGTTDMNVSYGLVNSSDIFMGEWNGSILGPHGVSNLFDIIFTHCI